MSKQKTDVDSCRGCESEVKVDFVWSLLLHLTPEVGSSLVWLSEMKFLDVFKDELPRKHPQRDSFIDQERRRPTTIIYRRGLDHRPCRLEIGRLLF